MHCNGVRGVRDVRAPESLVLAPPVSPGDLVDSARLRGRMSSSLSISRRLTENVEEGMRLKSNLEGLSNRGCLGRWLANMGAIDS
jgi:hypothetical protein